MTKSYALPFNHADISAEYRRLGYRLGWTFMMTPAERLEKASVCVVGLNPGGSEPGAEIWSCEQGNAYHTEKNWGAPGNQGYVPLQLQVQEMVRLLDLGPDDYLAAQFIPFRSRSYASLERATEAVEFGKKLWTEVLAVSPARLFLCLGNEVTQHLVRLTRAQARPGPSLCTGWRATTIGCYQTSSNEAAMRTIVRLPHLSRYRIFGRFERYEQASPKLSFFGLWSILKHVVLSRFAGVFARASVTDRPALRRQVPDHPEPEVLSSLRP